MYSTEELANDFRKLGIRAADTVHASVRAVGEVAGGPDQIHLALKSVLTSEGTLMMYASCPRYMPENARSRLPAREAATTASPENLPNLRDRIFALPTRAGILSHPCLISTDPAGAKSEKNSGDIS